MIPRYWWGIPIAYLACAPLLFEADHPVAGAVYVANGLLCAWLLWRDRRYKKIHVTYRDAGTLPVLPYDLDDDPE